MTIAALTKPKSTYTKKRTEGVINRVYKFPLSPTLVQVTALEEALATQCYLYNDMLRFRKQMYAAHALMQSLRLAPEGNEPWSFEEAEGEDKLPKIFLWGRRIYSEDLAILAGVRLRELLKDIDTRTAPVVMNELLPAIEASMREMVLIQDSYTRLVHEAQVAHDAAPTEDTAKELKKVTGLLQTVNRGHISLGDLKKRFITKPRQEGHPYLSKIGYGVSTATAIRLDRTYQNFFRRLKAGENPGEMRFKSPANYHCLAYNAYGDGCKFDEDVHEVFCDHCQGKGVFNVTEKPCNGCNGTGARGKHRCNKCCGAKTVLDVPLGLRQQLGGQPLHDIDMLASGKVKRRDATAALVAGKYTCPLCQGVGKRTENTARVRLLNIGEIKVREYRALPPGTVIRNLSITRQRGTQWSKSAKRFLDSFFVCLTLEIPFTPPEIKGSPIGLALGLLEFVDSNNRSYSVPGHLVAAQGHLAAIQQSVSLQKKGSDSRREAVRYLGRAHRRIADARQHWHRQLASDLTADHGLIVVQKTDWKKLARRPAPIPDGDVFPGEPGPYAPNGAKAKSRFNTKITDAAPAAVILALQSTAERNGCKILVERVDERCSNCGKAVEKPEELVPLFECPHCGEKISHRLNKAKNLLNIGTAVQG